MFSDTICTHVLTLTGLLLTQAVEDNITFHSKGGLWFQLSTLPHQVHELTAGSTLGELQASLKVGASVQCLE